MRKVLDALIPNEAEFSVTHWPTGAKVPVVNTFVLREMTCDNHLIRYRRMIHQATEDHTEELIPYLDRPRTEREDMAMKMFMHGQADLIAWVLGLCPENLPLPTAYPLDEEGKPVEIEGSNDAAEWVRQNISYAMRVKIIAGQNELNGMGNLDTGARDLLTKALVQQGTDQVMEEGLARQAIAQAEEDFSMTTAPTMQTVATPHHGTNPARDLKRVNQAKRGVSI